MSLHAQASILQWRLDPQQVWKGFTVASYLNCMCATLTDVMNRYQDDCPPRDAGEAGATPKGE